MDPEFQITMAVGELDRCINELGANEVLVLKRADKDAAVLMSHETYVDLLAALHTTEAALHTTEEQT